MAKENLIWLNKFLTFSQIGQTDFRHRASLVIFPASDCFRCTAVVMHTEVDVYCECRMPDDHKLMLQYDNCNMWYHAQCVGVSVKPRITDTWVCMLFSNSNV